MRISVTGLVIPNFRIRFVKNLIYLDKKYGIVDCVGNTRTLDLQGTFSEWIFPQDRFMEYEVSDEWWCRKYNVGYEKLHFFSMMILRAECMGTTPDYIVYKDHGVLAKDRAKLRIISPCLPI